MMTCHHVVWHRRIRDNNARGMRGVLRVYIITAFLVLLFNKYLREFCTGITMKVSIRFYEIRDAYF